MFICYAYIAISFDFVLMYKSNTTFFKVGDVSGVGMISQQNFWIVTSRFYKYKQNCFFALMQEKH